MGGELAESLSWREGWERNDWGLLTTTQNFSALAGFQSQLGEATQIVHCDESLCIFNFFLMLREFKASSLMKVIWTYSCSDMFLFGGGWKGEQLQLSTGVWESFTMLRMTAMWEGDTVWRHCLEEHKGLFVEWPSGRGVTKLHFVGIQQYLLNECVYFHQWHTKAARSAWGLSVHQFL